MIYLLRHGTLGSHVLGKYLGQKDIPLDANGIRQAENWAASFPEQEMIFDAILSSDLVRCKTTAEIIASPQAQNARVKLVPELREISLGDWDGKERRHIKAEFPDAWGSHGTDPDFCPPNGESFSSLQARAVPIIENAIEDSRENILIVTHSGVIRSVLCYYLKMPLSRMFSIEVDYSGLSAINGKKNIAFINRINCRQRP